MRRPYMEKCTPFEKSENKKISAKKYLTSHFVKKILFSGYYFLFLDYTSFLGDAA